VLPVDHLALHVIQPHPQVERLIVQPQLCAGRLLLLLLAIPTATAALLLLERPAPACC
jgi:hypothetical protein